MEKGDVISPILPNGLSFLISFLGVTWARAIAAPLNSAYPLNTFMQKSLKINILYHFDKILHTLWMSLYFI